MKEYKNNIIIQTALLITLITLLIWSIINPPALIMILYFQFFLGVIQYFSAWFLKHVFPEDKLIRIYLTIASLEITSCFLLAIATSQIEINYIFGFAVVILIPWCLAIMYWFISFKNVKYLFFKKSIFQ